MCVASYVWMFEASCGERRAGLLGLDPITIRRFSIVYGILILWLRLYVVSIDFYGLSLRYYGYHTVRRATCDVLHIVRRSVR